MKPILHNVFDPRFRIPSAPLQTGQTVSYVMGDDGDLEKGIIRLWTVLTTGQFSGTTNITTAGKTFALSNNCVIDERTGLMWARYVPDADIGVTTTGRMFGAPYTLGPKTDISFTAGTKIINSAAGDFNISALYSGRKVVLSGAGVGGNNHEVTVDSITANDLTTIEVIFDEAAGASISFATNGDTMWDVRDQANANSLGGYTDWYIPNISQLFSLVDFGSTTSIDTTAFPSAPEYFYWSSTAYRNIAARGHNIRFGNLSMAYYTKVEWISYIRLVRDN